MLRAKRAKTSDPSTSMFVAPANGLANDLWIHKNPVFEGDDEEDAPKTPTELFHEAIILGNIQYLNKLKTANVIKIEEEEEEAENDAKRKRRQQQQKLQSFPEEFHSFILWCWNFKAKHL
eukprot:m.167480 g.167480  ORF g.167480 m.167480 type:complete len:120 (-) comp13464_c2_seq4:1599-1958(-)